MANIVNVLFGGKDLSKASSLTLNGKNVTQLKLDGKIIWPITPTTNNISFTTMTFVGNNNEHLFFSAYDQSIVCTLTFDNDYIEKLYELVNYSEGEFEALILNNLSLSFEVLSILEIIDASYINASSCSITIKNKNPQDFTFDSMCYDWLIYKDNYRNYATITGEIIAPASENTFPITIDNFFAEVDSTTGTINYYCSGENPNEGGSFDRREAYIVPLSYSVDNSNYSVTMESYPSNQLNITRDISGDPVWITVTAEVEDPWAVRRETIVTEIHY